MARRKKRRFTKGQGPAREIVAAGTHRTVGAIHFPGITLYPAEWESPGERQLIQLLLVCADVTSIAAQAETIHFPDNDRIRRYTPDLEVVSNGIADLIEEKSLAYLIKPDNLERFLTIAAFLRAQGRQVVFVTHDQMKPIWLRNAALLWRHLRREISAELHGSISATLDDAQPISALLARQDCKLDLADIYGLIGQRKLSIDWDKPLNREALVSLPDQPFRRMTYETVRTSGRYADLLSELAMGRRPPDQRLRAAACARRWPLLPPSPLGFVGGLDAARLGHLKRAMSAKLAAPTHEPTDDDRTPVVPNPSADPED